MRRTAIFKLFSTHSKICIIGGGTGGLNLSAHLLRANIPACDMRIIEPSKTHYYQPGWTMLGSDLCNPDLTYRPMADVLPHDIAFTNDRVTKVDA